MAILRPTMEVGSGAQALEWTHARISVFSILGRRVRRYVCLYS